MKIAAHCCLQHTNLAKRHICCFLWKMGSQAHSSIIWHLTTAALCWSLRLQLLSLECNIGVAAREAEIKILHRKAP